MKGVNFPLVGDRRARSIDGSVSIPLGKDDSGDHDSNDHCQKDSQSTDEALRCQDRSSSLLVASSIIWLFILLDRSFVHTLDSNDDRAGRTGSQVNRLRDIVGEDVL